jgi:hypothetical protein
MLNELSRNPRADIEKVIDTPGEDEDIVSVCDKLLTSLRRAGEHAEDILSRLKKMKALQ